MPLGRSLLLGSLAAGLLASCGPGTTGRPPSASTTEPPSHAMAIDLLLRQENPLARATGEVCTGFGGYGDIRPGAQVVVKDGSGNVIATSTLGPGSTISSGQAVLPGGRSTYYCQFAASVTGVPKVAFYEVSIVARRGGLTTSFAAMVEAHWTVYLELG